MPKKGFKQSKETREHMSLSKKEWYAKGNVPWNKGKPWSDEVKRKISLSRGGTGKPIRERIMNKDKNIKYVMTKQHSANVSKALVDHKHSEATKKKIGDSNRGKPRPHKKKIKIVEFWER